MMWFTDNVFFSDFIDIWLNSIHGHSKVKPGQPPVILVGTHTDKLDPVSSENFNLWSSSHNSSTQHSIFRFLLYVLMREMGAVSRG